MRTRKALHDAMSVAEAPGGLAAADAAARWSDIQRRADDLAQTLYALREAVPKDSGDRARIDDTLASLQAVRSAMDAERSSGGASLGQAEVVRSRLASFESSLRALRAPSRELPHTSCHDRGPCRLVSGHHGTGDDAAATAGHASDKLNQHTARRYPWCDYRCMRSISPARHSRLCGAGGLRVSAGPRRGHPWLRSCGSPAWTARSQPPRQAARPVLEPARTMMRELWLE
jgi:hypothetical protein